MKENFMQRLFLLFSLCVMFTVALAQLPPTPSAEGAKVYFANLNDGDTVTSPILVQFGLTGMGVAPAGMQFENTGHHHLLVDVDETTLVPNAPLPATDTILHFGKGQTETTLELAPGEHTLQLMFGDFSHILHEPNVVSEKITITVE
ncbi:MAG: DUF4399 domain-containing protein [Trueperaceae bacterium]